MHTLERPATPAAPADTGVALAQWQCQDVLLRFFHDLDEYRYEAMLALLTDDAQWHRQGQVLRGHAAILAAMQARSPTVHVRHIVTNVVVDVDGPGQARAVSYLTGYKTDPGQPVPAPVRIQGPLRVGVIDTGFRREARGWRICAMDLRSAFEFSA